MLCFFVTSNYKVNDILKSNVNNMALSHESLKKLWS